MLRGNLVKADVVEVVIVDTVRGVDEAFPQRLPCVSWDLKGLGGGLCGLMKGGSKGRGSVIVGLEITMFYFIILK